MSVLVTGNVGQSGGYNIENGMSVWRTEHVEQIGCDECVMVSREWQNCVEWCVEYRAENRLWEAENRDWCVKRELRVRSRLFHIPYGM